MTSFCGILSFPLGLLLRRRQCDILTEGEEHMGSGVTRLGGNMEGALER